MENKKLGKGNKLKIWIGIQIKNPKTIGNEGKLIIDSVAIDRNKICWSYILVLKKKR